MNEATLIIIIGLIMDIIGALLIVGPMRHRKYMFKRFGKALEDIFEHIGRIKDGKEEEISPETNKARIDDIVFGLNERLVEEITDYKKFNLGIAILIIGFILQIIGNWVLNPLV